MLKSQKPPQPRGVGYVRVSTGKQALSPAAQAAKIEAMAALQGIDLIETITDLESAKEGSVKKRPGLIRILDLARRQQIQRVVIAKLDRLTRSVVDLGAILAQLDKHGVGLVSATETWMDTGSAAGRMILNIITAVAQWEREAIAERTAAVLQYKRQHRLVYNHAPFGYTRKRDKLVPKPEEQTIIRRIKAMRTKGQQLRAIADRLNSDRVPTKKRGGRWHASTIANVLRLAA